MPPLFLCTAKTFVASLVENPFFLLAAQLQQLFQTKLTLAFISVSVFNFVPH